MDQPSPPPSSPPPPFRIVLIEDAEPDVVLVREALELTQLKFDLQVLEDGEKAVEYLDSLDRDSQARNSQEGDGRDHEGAALLPHLFLLDLNLPKKGGDQVLERLRRSAGRHLPVVILTSSDSPRDKARASQFQVTEYFRKPSRLEEFMKLGLVVAQILKKPETSGPN